MAAPILQTLVGLIFVLLGIAMANKPPAARSEQWLYRGLFISLGFLFAALAWIPYKNELKKEAEASEKIQALEVQSHHTNQIIVQVPQKDDLAIKSNLLNLQLKYYSLLCELETNPSIDPNFRERIIITKTEFERHTSASNLAQPK
jgi:hypothetical protein